MPGKQFAESDPLSITDHIEVKRDKYENEIPVAKKFEHDNATPEEGNWNFGGNQYDDSVGKGGYGSYGKEVSAPPSAERGTVNVGRYPTDRGKE